MFNLKKTTEKTEQTKTGKYTFGVTVRDRDNNVMIGMHKVDLIESDDPEKTVVELFHDFIEWFHDESEAHTKTFRFYNNTGCVGLARDAIGSYQTYFVRS